MSVALRWVVAGVLFVSPLGAVAAQEGGVGAPASTDDPVAVLVQTCREIVSPDTPAGQRDAADARRRSCEREVVALGDKAVPALVKACHSEAESVLSGAVARILVAIRTMESLRGLVACAVRKDGSLDWVILFQLAETEDALSLSHPLRAALLQAAAKERSSQSGTALCVLLRDRSGTVDDVVAAWHARSSAEVVSPGRPSVGALSERGEFVQRVCHVARRAEDSIRAALLKGFSSRSEWGQADRARWVPVLRGQLGDKGALVEVRALARDSAAEEELRYLAITALGHVGDKGDLPFLEELAELNRKEEPTPPGSRSKNPIATAARGTLYVLRGRLQKEEEATKK